MMRYRVKGARRIRYRSGLLLVYFLCIAGSVPAGLVAECGDSSSYIPNEFMSAQERCELEAWAATTGTSALVVSLGGAVIFELDTDRAQTPIHIMSVTKSVVSLAVGRMLQEGQLASLDVKLSDLFPEWRQGDKAKITLRHILSHSTGIQDHPNAGLEIEPAPDVIQLALAADLVEEPGSTFRYNNKAANLLAGVVDRLTGQALDDYLVNSIFLDLEIEDVQWLRDPSGNPYGMAGLSLKSRDLLKLGELVNAQGKWHGKQVVDKDFLQEALIPQYEDNRRVGLFWWLLEGPPSGFQANGWLGQWLIGLPELDAVAVRLVDRADAVESDTDDISFMELVNQIFAIQSDP